MPSCGSSEAKCDHFRHVPITRTVLSGQRVTSRSVSARIERAKANAVAAIFMMGLKAKDS